MKLLEYSSIHSPQGVLRTIIHPFIHSSQPVLHSFSSNTFIIYFKQLIFQIGGNMKKVFFIVVLFLSSFKLFAQEEEIPSKQFMLWITGVGSTEEVTHYIDAPGAVWEYSSGNFIVSSDQEIYHNSLVTIGNANFSSANWPGFNFKWINQPPTTLPSWGLGLYKVSNSKQTDKYFYLDARDAEYASGSYNPDFKVFFNNSMSKYIQYLPTPSDTLNKGDVIRIWDIFGKSPNTGGLQNYWSNSLAAVNDGNDHPKLIWGPYPDPGSLQGTITGHKIYRSANHPPGQPGSFSLLTTINDPDIYEYTDNSATMGNDYNANSYYVKAVYEDEQESSGETSATNTVEVRLQIPQKQAIDFSSEKTFDLGQNYPNPFNPNTEITFIIGTISFVTLKIYDVLGNEIAELINETKEPGKYLVSFDASKLSSGIYFYTVKANGYSLTKKMLLTK